MGRIYVTGQVDPQSLVEFKSIDVDGNTYSFVAGKDAFSCYASPQRGEFAIRLRYGGHFEVAVNKIPRWVIAVPGTPAMYELSDLVSRTLIPTDEDNVKLGGSRMFGPLILSESPVESSEPLQAATKEFVHQQVAEDTVTFEFLQPTALEIIEHGLKDEAGLPRFPQSVQLAKLTGQIFTAPIKHLDETSTKITLTSTQTFRAHFK
jgi:hypothetical protein